MYGDPGIPVILAFERILCYGPDSKKLKLPHLFSFDAAYFCLLIDILARVAEEMSDFPVILAFVQILCYEVDSKKLRPVDPISFDAATFCLLIDVWARAPRENRWFFP